jgi:hypothetical protein
MGTASVYFIVFEGNGKDNKERDMKKFVFLYRLAPHN